MNTTPRITDIRRALRAIDPAADFKVSRYDVDEPGSVKVTVAMFSGVAQAGAWLEANGYTVNHDRGGRVDSRVVGGRWNFRHSFVAWPVAS